MSAFTKQGQLKAVSSLLARKVREYFETPEHRKEFEKWYEQRYGKAYQWRQI